MTSAGVQLYGEVLWNPLFLIDKWESRPAVFFAAFAFGVVTLLPLTCACWYYSVHLVSCPHESWYPQGRNWKSVPLVITNG
ncbi:hypothetical protein BS17DRAFT_428940 [Gyrodon lividus]|nr:hypothetical protein BS17DRAFT_428940 [Gyrodon lividus]